jgi:hypothetical protein
MVSAQGSLAASKDSGERASWVSALLDEREAVGRLGSTGRSQSFEGYTFHPEVVRVV